MPFLRCFISFQPVHACALVAAIALSSWPGFPVHAAGDGRSVIGQWKFTAALDGAEITSLDEREADQLVGHVFTVATDKVQFGSQVCLPPDFQEKRVEPRLYLREQAHASASRLGLPNPVSVVDLGCTVVFVKNPNRLVIFWKGWFFDARRLR
ncbi:hypothetical protein Q4S45_16385 [Massilia sp. R2A-15]|uniref:hypothetical protein n=1 Tax=Massilia sp. R2A-15 TaxID=3064278 RepID=UPI0027339615|nr:hypothetical protein [Massilia sp. R2A-15]WLI88302.1 hypothetical protein Q4S45_16385 [Massilia sp. R2A-15]